MKQLIKKTLRKLGFEIKRIQGNIKPGSESRPIGETKLFLEDVSARGFNPRGIIDVGANSGNWTKMVKSVFPDAKVLMIEPQVEMKTVLEELCSGREDLDYVQAGAGKESGELVQTIWEDLQGSSFLPQIDEDKIKQGTQRVTKIVTIDDLLKNRDSFFPDLVKLDVQGYELEALKGAQSLFGKTELFIMETSLYPYMEKMPITADCFYFMHERGYDFYDFTEFQRRPLDGALGQADFAFAKRGGQLRQSNKW